MGTHYHSDGTPCSRYCKILQINNCISRGLDNLGNTCYLNSSLQFLASSDHFIESLCSCLYEIREDKEKSLSAQCPFISEIANVIESVTYNPTIFSFNVQHFYSVFTKYAKEFNDGDQHDALEAIQTIMELIDKEISIINKYKEQKWVLESTIGDLIHPTSSKPSYHTSISLPTNGMLCDVMMCLRCGSRRQITNTPFVSISLPIAKTPWWRMDPTCRKNYYALFKSFNLYHECNLPVNSTLVDCLREFTSPDDIEGVSCKGCGVLNTLLNPSAFPSGLSEEHRNILKQTLHKARSSHDLESDLKTENSIPISEGQGFFKKYELIGRPPKTLILHLQRKMAIYNPLLSKQSIFVDIPQYIDLREFCVFSQSVPSTHLGEAMDDPEEKKEERRLRRVNSWKEDADVTEESIREMEDFFSQSMMSSTGRRRSSSIDSNCGDYPDVYEIKDESMLFDDEEEPKPHLDDTMLYNPYMQPNSLRGGGQPIMYKLTGVIHHMGSGFGGHYVCFRKVKIHKKETWVMFNDIFVQEVQWKDVNTKDVYLVNYELV